MTYKIKALKEGWKEVTSKITKETWFGVIMGVLGWGLATIFLGNLAGGILLIFLLLISAIIILFIWSLFYILEEYGKIKSRPDLENLIHTA